MIRCVEQAAGSADARTPPAIRALTVTLLPALSSVPCDGRLVRLSDRCYAMRGFSTSYVNATLFPLHELLWRRTTLVLRKDQSWQLLEFGEDVAKLESLDEALPDPETIESVITVAHDHLLMSLASTMSRAILRLSLYRWMLKFMSPMNLPGIMMQLMVIVTFLLMIKQRRRLKDALCPWEMKRWK